MRQTGERIMSAKQYREYADECLRSAKKSTLVKECRELLQTAEAWLQPNQGAWLLSSLIPFLDLPNLAHSLVGDERCRLQKIASDTLCGVCKTHVQPLILGRRPFWSRWPKLGRDLLSERHMPETCTPVQFLSWIAETDVCLVLSSMLDGLHRRRSYASGLPPEAAHRKEQSLT
jgi:hypothetical protein